MAAAEVIPCMGMTETLVKVSVTAGARREVFSAKGENAFTISVKEKAERNAANMRVRALIARHFCIADTAVRIIAGHRSKNKKFVVVL